MVTFIIIIHLVWHNRSAIIGEDLILKIYEFQKKFKLNLNGWAGFSKYPPGVTSHDLTWYSIKKKKTTPEEPTFYDFAFMPNNNSFILMVLRILLLVVKAKFLVWFLSDATRQRVMTGSEQGSYANRHYNIKKKWIPHSRLRRSWEILFFALGFGGNFPMPPCHTHAITILPNEWVLMLIAGIIMGGQS